MDIMEYLPIAIAYRLPVHWFLNQLKTKMVLIPITFGTKTIDELI